MAKLNSTYPDNALAHLSLGKTAHYPEQYDASLLHRVTRKLGRDLIGLAEKLPFIGEDLWNSYEFSWLNMSGKPQVAILQCRVPVDSPNLIESKSFKLYLNSFNQSQFADQDAVQQRLSADLSHCAGAEVKVTLQSVYREQPSLRVQQLAGECLDHIEVTITDYQPNSDYLRISDQTEAATVYSHLLKSNCLITDQPDWASVVIKYQGPKIEREGLLQYLISFRQHNEFHEQCVERIFMDVMQHCQPQKLTVLARYNRRGGLDINPFRSNFEQPYDNIRLVRQ